VTAFDAWYRALHGPVGAVFGEAMAEALGPVEHIGQQGLVSAAEIERLARGAGIGPGRLVLDVCCGPGGPAAWLGARTGCLVVGVDRSTAALRLDPWWWRRTAGGGSEDPRRGGEADRPVPHRRVVALVPPLPFRPRSFDAVVLLESCLGFPDQGALLAEVARVLRPGGGLAATVELGDTRTARRRFSPAKAREIHLAPASDFRALLDRHGFRVLQWEALTSRHAAVARRLAAGLRRRRDALRRRRDRRLIDALAASTAAWADLLEEGQVEKVGLVARLRDPGDAGAAPSNAAVS